jgi:hypothetical protein
MIKKRHETSIVKALTHKGMIILDVPCGKKNNLKINT